MFVSAYVLDAEITTTIYVAECVIQKYIWTMSFELLLSVLPFTFKCLKLMSFSRNSQNHKMAYCKYSCDTVNFGRSNTFPFILNEHFYIIL